MLKFLRRPAVIATLIGMGLVGLLMASWPFRAGMNPETQAFKPIADLRDGVFFISPDNYAETVLQLTKPNAVFLPAPQNDLQVSGKNDLANGYVGPEGCRDCHASYVESAAFTAHFRTCRMPHSESLPDSFDSNQNTLATGNPDMFFEMSQTDNDFYQSLIVKRRGEKYVHSERIGLVTGSAKYGQTFLYWKNQCLYELPVSHFTDLGKWVNSPGYIDGVANFARPISDRCLECHTTWFEQRGAPFNRFVSEGAILGVTCEKCHGPGREHVEYHRRVPAEREAKHIVNPASLTRDRSMDMCSLCHSGAGESLQKSFSYRPGDRLIDFIRIPPDKDSGPGGVHSANQQARMALSRCFQESSEMQCTTCHNPHQQERGDARLFIERCLKCHATTDCGVVEQVGKVAEEHCIDCHMPRRADSLMPMQVKEETFRPMLRDHRIDIWQDASAAVLEDIAPGQSVVTKKKTKVSEPNRE